MCKKECTYFDGSVMELTHGEFSCVSLTGVAHGTFSAWRRDSRAPSPRQRRRPAAKTIDPMLLLFLLLSSSSPQYQEIDSSTADMSHESDSTAVRTPTHPPVLNGTGAHLRQR